MMHGQRNIKLCKNRDLCDLLTLEDESTANIRNVDNRLSGVTVSYCSEQRNDALRTSSLASASIFKIVFVSRLRTCNNKLRYCAFFLLWVFFQV
jgi:hypothetical protein